MGALDTLQSSGWRCGLTRSGKLGKVAGRDFGGSQRLEAHWLSGAVPTDRPAPIPLQALRVDTLLPDLHRPTKAKLEKAMKDHILAQATLMGTYQRHH
jgi:phosphatidylethanolamine-binding protein (PEBP) family uncharacterized protein